MSSKFGAKNNELNFEDKFYQQSLEYACYVKWIKHPPGAKIEGHDGMDEDVEDSSPGLEVEYT